MLAPPSRDLLRLRLANPDLPSRGRLRFGIVAIAVVAFAILRFASPAAAEEAVQLLHSDIKVARDGTVHVEETIRVNAEGNRIRHGVYRDISTNFEDAAGKVHGVGFDLLGLTRDGNEVMRWT